jgi:hypothetical protein
MRLVNNAIGVALMQRTPGWSQRYSLLQKGQRLTHEPTFIRRNGSPIASPCLRSKMRV